jgi:hypothetical protein
VTTFAGQYRDEAYLPDGTFAAGSPVAVYLRGTATPAALYTSRTKAVAAANPVTVDNYGNLSFYADPGLYTLSLNGLPLDVAVQADPADTVVVPAALAADVAFTGEYLAQDATVVNIAALLAYENETP